MLAIDTNVVVRYLVADDPAQARRAKALIDGQEVLVATTVLLETEWVLRSAYGHDREDVLAALRRFAGLPNVTLENPPLAARALDWAAKGMDFADALHLAAAEGCDAFLTFDRRLGAQRTGWRGAGACALTADRGAMPNSAPLSANPTVVVIGGGPAGLMAAEVLSTAGARVTVHERMPSFGRKFLMAGRGGLNLTHSEPFEPFLGRYRETADRLRPLLEAFPPSALVAWAQGLGQPTFTGGSGRIFPKSLKASPLLRAWLARLRAQGVELLTRHDWRGWNAAGELVFAAPDGEQAVRADAVVLALGGASWPRLGSTGDWTSLLQARGVRLSPLRPANCGFMVEWSPAFRDRFAGQPLKGARLSFAGQSSRAEAVVTAYGLEGGGVYALGAALRDAIERDGAAMLTLDLKPDLDEPALAARLGLASAGQSLANRLRKAARLSPLAVNLLREAHGALPPDPAALAHAIKAAPLRLVGVQPIARAISTAGGVALDQLDEHLMLKTLPGVFCAGEMLDWEAPTGGYLLQACFATGAAAAEGVLSRLCARS